MVKCGRSKDEQTVLWIFKCSSCICLSNNLKVQQATSLKALSIICTKRLPKYKRVGRRGRKNWDAPAPKRILWFNKGSLCSSFSPDGSQTWSATLRSILNKKQQKNPIKPLWIFWIKLCRGPTFTNPTQLRFSGASITWANPQIQNAWV